MTHNETFIAYGDLLRDLARQCRAAETFLRSTEGTGTRADQEAFSDWVANAEKRIAGSLEQCAQDGPENLVHRRLQFKPEHQVWKSPDDFHSGLRQVIAVNETAVEVLQEETDKSAPVETGEKMQDLTHQLQAINRKISMSLVTAEDL